jgi:hypothetical protein
MVKKEYIKIDRNNYETIHLNVHEKTCFLYKIDGVLFLAQKTLGDIARKNPSSVSRWLNYTNSPYFKVSLQGEKKKLIALPIAAKYLADQLINQNNLTIQQLAVDLILLRIKR